MKIMDCPFCNSKADVIDLVDVDHECDRQMYKPCCVNYECIMYYGSFKLFPSKAKAIKDWNKNRKVK